MFLLLGPAAGVLKSLVSISYLASYQFILIKEAKNLVGKRDTGSPKTPPPCAVSSVYGVLSGEQKSLTILKLSSCQGEEDGRVGLGVWDQKVQKLLHIEWIYNMVLLYSIRNFIKYLVINHNVKDKYKFSGLQDLDLYIAYRI